MSGGRRVRRASDVPYPAGARLAWPRGQPVRAGGRAAVVGLGVMGLLHLLALRADGIEAVGYDLNPARVAWARDRGLDADAPPAEPAPRGEDAALRLVVDQLGGKVVSTSGED